MESNHNTSTIENEQPCKIISSAEKTTEALDVAIDILEEIQRLIAGPKPKKLRVRLGEKTVAEFPLAVTAAAALAAGLAAVLVTKLAIEIEHEDNSQ